MYGKRALTVGDLIHELQKQDPMNLATVRLMHDHKDVLHQVYGVEKDTTSDLAVEYGEKQVAIKAYTI